MPSKWFLVLFSLFTSTTCLAATNSTAVKPEGMQQSQPSPTSQNSGSSPNPTTDFGQRQSQNEEKQPDMAQYCKEHTC